MQDLDFNIVKKSQIIMDKTVTFINELVDKLNTFTRESSEGIAIKKNSKSTFFLKTYILITSFFELILLLLISKKDLNFYLTHTSFTKKIENRYIDNFYKELLQKENSIFINYDKFNYISKINDIKVYNIGIVVRLLQKTNLIKPKTKLINYCRWKYLNELFTRNLDQNKIYIPVYSNDCGFAFVFNKFRNNYILIEVQHGSVVNYPPYSFVSEFKLVDKFYYRNNISKEYLLNNLFKIHQPNLLQISTYKPEFSPATNSREILYISSYEFNGFHEVFKDFLLSKPKNCNLKFRLHPRQIEIENLFTDFLNENDISYKIDNSINLFDNLPQNTIVVSPFSSVIEEAYDLGLKTIIIDELGAKRFNYLIDDENCIYTTNLIKHFQNE